MRKGYKNTTERGTLTRAKVPPLEDHAKSTKNPGARAAPLLLPPTPAALDLTMSGKLDHQLHAACTAVSSLPFQTLELTFPSSSDAVASLSSRLAELDPALAPSTPERVPAASTSAPPSPTGTPVIVAEPPSVGTPPKGLSCWRVG